MTWTAADIPDQTGRIAVVTGANSGLGFETTKALAIAGGHVVMAVRDLAKADTARNEILALHPESSLEVVSMDLADQSSIKSGAAQILDAHPSIDILVNNAGVMAMPERKTVDGFEMQLGVNHLGHWTLTAALLQALLRADRARVVTVTSVARHQGTSIDPVNPHLHGRYKPWRAYSQSKLANYHFGLGLQERFEEAGLTAQSLIAHPGLTNTNLQSTTVDEGGGGLLATTSHELAERLGMSADVGARPQLRAATDPKAKGGELYGPMFMTTGPAIKLPVARVGAESAIQTLWTVSARETEVPLNVAAIAAEQR